MNRFVKLILIIASVLFGAGLVAVIVSLFMGASFRDIQDTGVGKAADLAGKIVGDHMNGAVSDEDSGQGPALSDQKRYDQVRSISIEAGAAEVLICYGNTTEVQVNSDPSLKLHTELEEGELEIECGSSVQSMKADNKKVEILLPKGMFLEELNIDSGASAVTVENISVQELDADVGAGLLTVYAPGKKENYTYEISCGLGQITIGDETHTGIADLKQQGSSGQKIDIDCGAGVVEVQFLED